MFWSERESGAELICLCLQDQLIVAALPVSFAQGLGGKIGGRFAIDRRIRPPTDS